MAQGLLQASWSANYKFEHPSCLELPIIFSWTPAFLRVIQIPSTSTKPTVHTLPWKMQFAILATVLGLAASSMAVKVRGETSSPEKNNGSCTIELCNDFHFGKPCETQIVYPNLCGKTYPVRGKKKKTLDEETLCSLIQSMWTPSCTSTSPRSTSLIPNSTAISGSKCTGFSGVLNMAG